MKLTVLGKSPAWTDAGGACSGYLVEAGDDPEHHHVGLVGRQALHEIDGVLGRHVLDRLGLSGWGRR